MGCGSSKPERAEGVELHPHPHQPHQQISGPIGGPVMVPPPYRDSSGNPIQHQSRDLDRRTLIRALDDMAAYLERQGVTAHVVTVGGAVNTMYLRSRQTTHDVDFFLANRNAPEHHVIHQAARHANRQAHGDLGGEWFNNSTQLFLSAEVQQDIANAAFQQNTIVYNRVGGGGGLVVYAAPWEYAFCGKLNRLCDANPRPYDLADAVVYLHQYLEARGRQNVSARKIYQWCERYRKQVTDAVLRQVDVAYRQKYGHHPIDQRSQP